jgi:hypothetical protein
MMRRLIYYRLHLIFIEAIIMSMTDWPTDLGTYLGINETTAALMLSLVVIFMLLLPVMLLARGKNAPTIWLIAVFFAECVTLGLGWLPLWVMIATICVMAIAVAFLGGKI